jgi:hypothetical protein
MAGRLMVRIGIFPPWFVSEGGGMSESLLMGFSEACEALNVSHDTFYVLVRKGYLRKRVMPGMKYGKYFREDVERLVQAGMPKASVGAVNFKRICDEIEQQSKGVQA